MGNYLSKLHQGRINSPFEGDLGIPNGPCENSLWSSSVQKHVREKSSTYVRPNYIRLNNLHTKGGWPSKSAVRLGLTARHKFKNMTVVISKPLKKE